MHEVSIVASLLDRVAREAENLGATSVRRVHLRIGELSGVEVDLLVTAYETFRERTVCAGAPLEIERIPARWACPRCGQQPARGGALRCPQCREPTRLHQGNEIVLQRIEMEVA